ncbi:hypothetical protein AMECASPLE_039076 [Ameca splendens]|uniref:Uncharacterized protein n=1 Tax=Ameca splendens TaxID=208324 RepID=A0ABV0YVJ5_9TELE
MVRHGFPCLTNPLRNDGPQRILMTHPSNRTKEGHICRPHLRESRNDLGQTLSPRCDVIGLQIQLSKDAAPEGHNECNRYHFRVSLGVGTFPFRLILSNVNLFRYL